MAEEVQLTVKYLSSPKLLRLQLQDAALRRHFLVQVHPHPPPNAPFSHHMPACAPCCRTAPCAGTSAPRRTPPMRPQCALLLPRAGQTTLLHLQEVALYWPILMHFCLCGSLSPSLPCMLPRRLSTRHCSPRQLRLPSRTVDLPC